MVLVINQMHSLRSAIHLLLNAILLEILLFLFFFESFENFRLTTSRKSLDSVLKQLHRF